MWGDGAWLRKSNKPFIPLAPRTDVQEKSENIPEEQKALALAAVGYMGKFLRRNTKPLGQDIPVAGTLI